MLPCMCGGGCKRVCVSFRLESLRERRSRAILRAAGCVCGEKASDTEREGETETTRISVMVLDDGRIWINCPLALYAVPLSLSLARSPHSVCIHTARHWDKQAEWEIMQRYGQHNFSTGVRVCVCTCLVYMCL